MPTYRAQVVFPFFTNLPQDVMTNTLHFDPLTPLGFEETADLVTPSLATFYNTIYAGSWSIGNYVVPTLAQVHWYDLSTPQPRVPYIVPLGATITPAATSTPTEVACVLSFQGPQVAGQPQARRRGRIYIGAIGSGWFAASSTSAFPTFSSTTINHVTAAAETLAEDVVADGVRWSVWSPTDQASALITNGWVDNSPDTQRRRSVDSSSRTLWTPTIP